ncbi:hypothetical protein SCYAM73S_01178 [Streptomyces cyaneofuscatus]
MKREASAASGALSTTSGRSDSLWVSFRRSARPPETVTTASAYLACSRSYATIAGSFRWFTQERTPGRYSWASQTRETGRPAARARSFAREPTPSIRKSLAWMMSGSSASMTGP